MARSRAVVLAVLVSFAVGVGVVGASSASAAAGDAGYQGPSYTGVPHAPTSDKPQSKLWYAQGSWWADMFDVRSGTWHIFRLDRTTEQWIDTGVVIDDRPDTLADVLWNGTHLYVASHVVTLSSDTSTTASQPNSPARLYRFSYGTRGYTLDKGFPVTITNQSSESMTIDRDSTGALWATWTQVTATSGGGFTSSVYVNSTSGGDTEWGTPYVLPVAGSTVAPDDISSVVAFGKNKVGVMWSNQAEDAVYWAVHPDGAPRTSWKGSPAIRGNREADDHLSIKAVQADTSGRVFAVVKTALDQGPSPVPSDPQIRLLSFKPGTGSWSATTVTTVADCTTRPLLVLDEAHQQVHVFATAPSTSGCPYSGAAGTIYDKTASMDNPVFRAGRGTPVIRDAAAPAMNDVTSTKQSVTAASGIVVLASNKTTQRYWHADLAITPPAPVASFTASATSGAAPLPVQFTDTSTGTPTSWAWDFGNGSTSTAQHPAHTYTAPGAYTVTLAVRNAGGASAPVTATVDVRPAASVAEVTAGASSTAAGTTAVPEVIVPRPAGVAAGDLLIAQLTVDGAPTMAALPAGWTTVTPTMSIAGGAKVYAYSRLVTDPAAEPAAYTWKLSSAQKWGAGMTVFTGVDPAKPFDTASTAAQDITYTATSLTVPGVTTLTDGAMLVGGVGLDNMTAQITQPAAWTEAWESTGGHVSELAHRQTGTAGASTALTWSLSKAAAGGAWVRALRPAPRVPTASFTASVASGTAPLPVQFTDTSTGGPTSWAWDFGDGTTATEQHPAHIYTAPGTYTVRLQASNAVGTSTPATATVTVAAAPAPAVGSFTASAVSGTAPLPVQFTDTSTGGPTSWAWDFGDGTTATEQHPAHTFTAPGTYTVRLIVSNAAGASPPATSSLTVSPTPPKVGATTTASSLGAKKVVINRPTGVVDGDVLVARVVTDSTVKSAPAGWTLLPGSTGRVSVYYRLVTRATVEPGSYTWQLTAPRPWTAVMTGVSGIDPHTPATAVPYAQAVWPPV